MQLRGKSKPRATRLSRRRTVAALKLAHFSNAGSAIPAAGGVAV
jgi:hypothetical protein